MKPQIPFDLQAIEICRQELGEAARRLEDRQKITGSLIENLGMITLGTMAIGSQEKGILCTGNNMLAHGKLPFTSGVIWAEGHGGLEHQQENVIGLGRLRSIKQLSLLGFPVKQGQLSYAIGFGHTRFLHTYDVIAIGLICAHNVGVKGKDLLALNLALAMHDVFTPACGDLMKFIDGRAFDEDSQLSTLLNHEPYLKMCGDLGIKPEEPIRICQEKNGLLCQIRDLADTLGYTAQDLSVLLSFFEPKRFRKCPDCYEDPEEQLLLEEVYALRSDFALLWENIETDSSGNLVFTDTERLYTFLRTRAILFRIIYYNQQTRNVEYLLGIRMIKLLIEKGILEYGQFISELSDEEIWDKVKDETGYDPSHSHNGALGTTHKFSSLDLARRYVQKKSDENTCALIYKWPSATKSKVNYWRVKVKDRTVPWGEAYPEKAAEIEKIMRQHDGYFVSLISFNHLHEISPLYWDELKQLEQSVLC